MNKPSTRLWLARFLIGAVLLMNAQSALAFFLHPQGFAPAYELSGIPGAAAIRGFGVLFLMWNVPYAVALIHPRRHRVSLYEAIVMQAIGLVGEAVILGGLPPQVPILRVAIWRFILFDGAGLIALLAAAALSQTTNIPGVMAAGPSESSR